MKEQVDRILIIEDDRTFSKVLEGILTSRFEVQISGSTEEARQVLGEQAFSGVLLDVRLGGPGSTDMDGITLLNEIKESRPLMPVVMMTAYGDIRVAVQAMRLGADDFVEKGAIEPVELCKRLREIISKARSSLKKEAEAAETRQLDSSNLVGSSEAMYALRNAIDMAANDGYCSVLVLGETGSGKEVVARAIHEQGWRREGPFVAVPTAGLSPGLLESELFGHEKGAFTGAIQAREGYIERAEGGILFLDEIGDLGVDLQVKLLRFLEDRLVFRVGSTRGRPVNTQVIAATHRPVRDFVSKGLLREDLYYRLRTIEIPVPPLRDRRDDVPLLADHFLHLLRKQGRTKLAGFGNPAIAALRQYEWPGNVRQLRAVVEWAVLAAMQAGHWVVELEDLPSELSALLTSIEGTSSPEYTSGSIVEHARAQAELECIERALIQTEGKKNEAMELLGYPNRQTMRRRIQQLRERFPDLWAKFAKVVEAYEKAGEQN